MSEVWWDESAAGQQYFKEKENMERIVNQLI